MKSTKILYWIFTVLGVGLMLFSGIQNIMMTQGTIELIVTQLGYPLYFVPMVGAAKVAGSIAVLIPGFPRIKEWAYAGLLYDLAAATYSTIAVGTPFSQWVFMLVFLGLVAGSYFFYHKRLREVQAS